MKTSSYFGIALGALLLASCYQPKVVMKTVIEGEEREIVNCKSSNRK